MVRPEILRKRLNKLDESIDIDRTIVFETLQHGLEDIEQLKRVFAGLL